MLIATITSKSVNARGASRWLALPAFKVIPVLVIN
jgi:hypothetical protein